MRRRPDLGGAMTSFGGGATEYYNLSGASGNPIQERLDHDGKLQPGSPVQIAAPGGQPGVDSRKRDDKSSSDTGGLSVSTPGTPAGTGSFGGGGGGGFDRGGGRPTK